MPIIFRSITGSTNTLQYCFVLFVDAIPLAEFLTNLNAICKSFDSAVHPLPTLVNNSKKMFDEPTQMSRARNSGACRAKAEARPLLWAARRAGNIRGIAMER